MIRIELSRGPIALIEVHHFATGVRLIAVARVQPSDPVRMVLTRREVDDLVAALTGAPPPTPSFEQLLKDGAFERTAPPWVKDRHDAEDRLQEALCQTWHVYAQRVRKGLSTDLALLRLVYRRRASSFRERFVRTRDSVGRDALDRPRPGALVLAEDMALTSPPVPVEMLVWLQELSQQLDVEEREILALQVQGDSMREIARQTGRSAATVHRRTGHIREVARAS